MFTTCLITSQLRYQFTGPDMPLQKLSGVAILVSLQECGQTLHWVRVARNHEIHQFANVQFICAIVVLKARNNHISNQSLSETARNLARSFVNYFFGRFGNSCGLVMWQKNTKLACTHQFAPLRRAWVNESAMSNVGSAFRDRRNSLCSVTPFLC